jgi:uncharacterized protein (TIGR02453 family)
MKFSGIPIAALDFYEDLEADNSKAFWNAHRQVYEESVRAPLEALAEALSGEFGSAKLFRPYRDVRFAKDKSPYKTQQGVTFGDHALYLSVSAAGLFLACGYWQASPDQVERLRRAVADDVAGAELERAIAAVTKAGFSVGGEQITRVPSGYPKDHPRASLLRHKTMTAHRELGAPAWLTSARAATEVAKAFRRTTPLTEWLSTHVGRSNERAR